MKPVALCKKIVTELDGS